MKLADGVPGPLGNERGVTLLMVLMAVVVLGLSLGVAGSTWRTVMQREREKELLFHGDQYRKAIESYYTKGHAGRQTYPRSLEDLLKDPRSVETVRHLRRLFNDPMTGEDWELIREGGKISGTVQASVETGRIKGVHSTSDLEPFKVDGFDEEYEEFADAETYRDWEFVYEPKQQPAKGKAPARDPFKEAAQRQEVESR